MAELNADTGKAKDKKTYPDHSIISRTIAFNTSINAQGKPVTENLDCWVISIRPDTLINEMDQDIMEEIFYTADRIGDNITENGVVGALRDYAIGEVSEVLGSAVLVPSLIIVDEVLGAVLDADALGVSQLLSTAP